MTALEELKSSARVSIKAKQVEIERLIEEHSAAKEENERLWNLFHDILLDLSSYARSTYQITVAAARDAQSVDEVAKLWKETHVFLSGLLSLWKGLAALMSKEPPMKDGLFDYTGELIAKLERASAQAYEFHS
jgi:hypothetical protein